MQRCSGKRHVDRLCSSYIVLMCWYGLDQFISRVLLVNSSRNNVMWHAIASFTDYDDVVIVSFIVSRAVYSLMEFKAGVISYSKSVL